MSGQRLQRAQHRQSGRLKNPRDGRSPLHSRIRCRCPLPDERFRRQSPDTVSLICLISNQLSAATVVIPHVPRPRQRDRREAHVEPHRARPCVGTHSIWPPPRTLRWGPRRRVRSAGQMCASALRVKWKSARDDQAFAAAVVCSAASTWQRPGLCFRP